MATSTLPSLEARSRASGGASQDAVHRLVARELRSRHPGGGTLLDIGCGSGRLWSYLRDRFDRYQGVDAVAYDGFPEEGERFSADLDAGALPLPADHAEVVVAAEVVEHLENPRAFFGELVRLCRPGGWVVVTTPNQSSALSLLTLLVRGRFAAFQDVDYPAHLTALLPVDLERIAGERGLGEIALAWSGRGRIPRAPWHYPAALSRLFPRLLSDNVVVLGRKGGAG